MQVDLMAEPKKLIKQLRTPSTFVASVRDIELVDEMPQLRTKP